MTGGIGTDRSRRRIWFFAGGLVLVAIFLASRLLIVDRLALFFDEANYIAAAMEIHDRGPSPDSLFGPLMYWGVPPLFTWFAAAVLEPISNPLLAGRIASALIGLAGLGFVGLAAFRLDGYRRALLCCALYTLCPFLLWYQRMAMFDGLLTATAAAAVAVTIDLIQAPRLSRGIGLGLCIACALWSKSTGPVLFLLPWCAVVATPGAQRAAVRQAALLATAIGGVGWLLLVLAPGSSSLFAVAHQHQIVHTSYLQQTATAFAAIGQALVTYATPGLLLLALTSYLPRRGTPVDPARRFVALWTLVGCAPFLIIHVDVAPRYVLYETVGLILLVPDGCRVLWTACARAGRLQVAPRALCAALVGGILGAMIVQDRQIVADPEHALLLPADHAAYVAGWAAGYALEPAIDRIQTEAVRRPLTLVASVVAPPGNTVLVQFAHDPAVHPVFADYRALTDRTLHSLSSDGARTVLLIEFQPLGQLLPLRGLSLRLIMRTRPADGSGYVALYRYQVAPRS